MSVITVDSSVLVPALQSWHAAHAQASAVLRRADVRVSGHVLLEAYSTLTGGRVKPRARPELAVKALLRFGQPLTLSAEGYLSALRRCARAGVAGGAVYDALIAATAEEAGAPLVSRDQRAARTYEAVDASYELIE
jgi:predicted nucleic acid-binding protein